MGECCKYVLAFTENGRKTIADQSLIPESCRHGKCVDKGISLFGEGSLMPNGCVLNWSCPLRTAHEYLNKSNINPKYLNLRYSNDFSWDVYGSGSKIEKKKNIIDAIINKFPMLYNEGKGIYLWSESTGTGKTMLASLILKAACGFCYKSYFITAYQLCRDLKSYNFNPGVFDYEKSRLKKLELADVVVIDEITSDMTEADHQLLYEFIEYVAVRGDIIIYTSNCDPSKLPARLAGRIYENSIVMEMPNVNVRVKKASSDVTDFVNKLLG